MIADRNAQSDCLCEIAARVWRIDGAAHLQRRRCHHWQPSQRVKALIPMAGLPVCTMDAANLRCSELLHSCRALFRCRQAGGPAMAGLQAGQCACHAWRRQSNSRPPTSPPSVLLYLVWWRWLIFRDGTAARGEGRRWPRSCLLRRAVRHLGGGRAAVLAGRVRVVVMGVVSVRLLPRDVP